ncbi:MAG: Rne/Rng family ribonuclease [Azoarcus sp.]|jgi:ribonuclease E|nr:Rne/Rng family ribonuclease [Azoarcus sp.]
MKRMLFNATQAEELRVAIVDGQRLIDLDIESANKEERKSNIYKATITRIEPSLEAAFVDYGSERHGFLPFKEIARSYFQPGADSRAGIREALREGQDLIVQVEKDERGNKGAALTTFVSLAGRYLVLMPNNPRGGGVSRRIEGDERTELREAMDQLEVPQGMSLIARTAAIGRSAEELRWDLDYLLQLWTAISNAAREQSGIFLIYQEGSLVIRAIRDYFQPDIGEILIDTDDIYEQASQFMGHVMPNNVSRIKRYSDDVPLFSRFQIEHQIESAYSRQVNLPLGGAVVIDHTEALVAIDVNSGRATKGADIEETAFKTNLEAAEEIARQLRLRDLGGLIVIDFIDMESAKNQREVENRLRDALRHDRARVQTGKISRFGLLELSRQRLRPALAETSYITCPRCTGTGHIRSIESSVLHILRILEEEAMKENTGAVYLQAPVEVATYLLNEKRVDIARIEFRHKIQLVIVPNRHMETPAHEIIRLRHDQLNQDDNSAPASYQMVQPPAEENPASSNGDKSAARQEAIIKSIAPAQPAPESRPAGGSGAAQASPGVISRITGWLTDLLVGARQNEPETPAAPASRGARARGNDRGNAERGGERRNGGGNARRGQRNESENGRSERGEKSAPPAAPNKAQRPGKARGESGGDRQERGEPAETDNARTSGNRRRRGRDRNDESDNTIPSIQAPATATTTPADAAPAKQQTRRNSAAKAVAEPAPAETETAVTEEQTFPAAPGETEAEATPEKRRRRRNRHGRASEATEEIAETTGGGENETGSGTASTSTSGGELFPAVASDARPASSEAGAPSDDAIAVRDTRPANVVLSRDEEPRSAPPPAPAETQFVLWAAASEEEPAAPAPRAPAEAPAPTTTTAPKPKPEETVLPVAAGSPSGVAPIAPADSPDSLPVAIGKPFQTEAPPQADTAANAMTAPPLAAAPPGAEPAPAGASTREDPELVMIETRSEKKAPSGDGAPEQSIRLGRKPHPPAAIDEEPLQQIETHRNT